jgi:hypothetical protein
MLLSIQHEISLHLGQRTNDEKSVDHIHSFTCKDVWDSAKIGDDAEGSHKISVPNQPPLEQLNRQLENVQRIFTEALALDALFSRRLSISLMA